MIDFGYKGTIKIILMNLGPHVFTYKSGHRLAQLLILRNNSTLASFTDGCHPTEETPVVPLCLNFIGKDADRGTKGFGSSGR